MAYDRAEKQLTVDEMFDQVTSPGLASPNRYWVSFNLPPGLTNTGVANDSLGGVLDSVKGGRPGQLTADVRDIGIMCNQMSFPGRTMQTVKNRHIGTPFSLPYTAEYPDVNFSFYLSNDLRERKYFELWQNIMVNVAMNSMNFYKEYVMPVHLMQLDNTGKVTYQITLIEAYPVSIDDVNNSFASQNEVSQCSVTMAYKHWVNEDIK